MDLRTVTFALCLINRLVFITEMESVYRAVRTGSLYVDNGLKYTNTSSPVEFVKARKADFSLCSISHLAIKMYGVVQTQLHTFLISILD